MSRFVSLPLFFIFALDYACTALQDWGELMDLNRTILHESEFIRLGLSELSYAASCANPIAIAAQHGSNKTKSSYQIQAELKTNCPCNPRQVPGTIGYDLPSNHPFALC